MQRLQQGLERIYMSQISLGLHLSIPSQLPKMYYCELYPHEILKKQRTLPIRKTWRLENVDKMLPYNIQSFKISKIIQKWTFCHYEYFTKRLEIHRLSNIVQSFMIWFPVLILFSVLSRIVENNNECDIFYLEFPRKKRKWLFSVPDFEIAYQTTSKIADGRHGDDVT